MRCAVFGRGTAGRVVFDLLHRTRIQAGVELTAYFDLIENSTTTSYSFYHAVNELHDEISPEKVFRLGLSQR